MQRLIDAGADVDEPAPDGGTALDPPLPPPPNLRTKWTRLVPHPVLIGHAASRSQVPRWTRPSAWARAGPPALRAAARRRGARVLDATRGASDSSLGGAAPRAARRAERARGAGRGARRKDLVKLLVLAQSRVRAASGMPAGTRVVDVSKMARKNNVRSQARAPPTAPPGRVLLALARLRRVWLVVGEVRSCDGVYL